MLNYSSSVWIRQFDFSRIQCIRRIRRTLGLTRREIAWNRISSKVRNPVRFWVITNTENWNERNWSSLDYDWLTQFQIAISLPGFTCGRPLATGDFHTVWNLQITLTKRTQWGKLFVRRPSQVPLGQVFGQTLEATEIGQRFGWPFLDQFMCSSQKPFL